MKGHPETLDSPAFESPPILDAEVVGMGTVVVPVHLSDAVANVLVPPPAADVAPQESQCQK